MKFHRQVVYLRAFDCFWSLFGIVGLLINGGLVLAIAGVVIFLPELTVRSTLSSVVKVLFLVAAAGFLGWVRFLTLGGLFSTLPRVVPYFEQRIDSNKETTTAFRNGKKIAAYLKSLDHFG